MVQGLKKAARHSSSRHDEELWHLLLWARQIVQNISEERIEDMKLKNILVAALATAVGIGVAAAILVAVILNVVEKRDAPTGYFLCMNVDGSQDSTTILFEGELHFHRSGWVSFYSPEMKTKVKTNLPCVAIYDALDEDE